jgi:hypothetical protein
LSTSTTPGYVQELVDYFLRTGYVVHGAKGIHGYANPPAISNDGFGDLRPRSPDVIGLDRQRQRIVFGIVKATKEDLDSESSLTDYNVYLDHKHMAGPHSSLLVVLLPRQMMSEFTSILTHYIHREYWHRVIPVASAIGDVGR